MITIKSINNIMWTVLTRVKDRKDKIMITDTKGYLTPSIEESITLIKEKRTSSLKVENNSI